MKNPDGITEDIERIQKNQEPPKKNLENLSRSMWLGESKKREITASLLKLFANREIHGGRLAFFRG